MLRCLVYCAMILTGLTLNGQTPEFFTTTDAEEIVLGSYVDVKFTLKNADGNDFEAPAFEGFTVISGPNRSNSMRIINGNVSKEMSISYSLRPKSVGRFRIGPARITTSNGLLSTKPVSITVVEGRSDREPSSEDIFIKAICSDSIAYIGQQIVLKYKLFTRLDVRSVNFAAQPEFEGFYTEELNTSSEKTRREVINGVEYATKVIKTFSLFPQQKGVYNIEPVAVNLGISSGTRSRNFFFSTQLEPRRVITNGCRIEIDELPNPRPISFSGAVGSYDAQASLTRRTVKTGEAINIILDISGDGDNKTVQAPNWFESDSFDIYEPNILEDERYERPGKIYHKKRFEYLLVPRVAGTFRLNPRFSYYNPDSAEYVTIIKNLPAVSVIQGSGERLDAKSKRSDLLQLKAIQNGNLKRKSRAFHWTKPYLLGLSLLLAVCLVIFMYAHYLKISGKKDPAEILKKQALTKALTRLENLDKYRDEKDKHRFYEELTRSLKQYLTDRYSIPAFHIGVERIESQMKELQISSAYIDELCHLLRHAERAIYAPGLESELDRIYEKTLSLISDLERHS